MMEQIIPEIIQSKLNELAQQEVYIHLETTNGAYATHHGQSTYSSGAYIRNAKVSYELAKITGNSPYRVGMKLEIGWIYAEGLTHYLIDEKNRLLLAGLNEEGKLAVALEISTTPFE